MPNVEIKQSIESIKIMINGLIFLCIKRAEFVSFQSWKENSKYNIEFYTTSKDILTEYDNRELWETVLRKLDESYIF